MYKPLKSYKQSISNGGLQIMLSEKIKEFRKQKGYTQETLHIKTGVGSLSVQKTGHGSISVMVMADQVAEKWWTGKV